MKRLHLAYLVPLCALAAFTAPAQTTTNATQTSSPKRIALDSPSPVLKRIDHTIPEYPSGERKKRVSGTVLIHTVVSTTGIPGDLKIVSSVDPALDKAAMDAAKNFRYEPPVVNGEPVEVETTITIVFSLNGIPAPPPSVPNPKMDEGSGNSPRDAAVPPVLAEPQHIIMDGKVLATKRLDHTSPEYPVEARMKHISGTVLMRVVISKAGIPTQIEMFAGADPLLDRAALEAVKQFRYSPATVNGEPAEVDSVISVIFSLGNETAPRPATPSAKIDLGWMKERQDSVAALDPNLVSSIRVVLNRSHFGPENLKSDATRYVATSRPVLVAYALGRKDADVVANEAIANVTAKIDPEFLTDLVILVFAGHLSREQIEGAAAPGAPPLQVSSEIRDAVMSGIRSTLHDYYSKVLVPEIDAEIRRINKN